MTNTTYDLKPGYYWKVTSDDGLRLNLMMASTTWADEYSITRFPLPRDPSDPEDALRLAMSRIRGLIPSLFADYTEDVIHYDKALKNITSSVLP